MSKPSVLVYLTVLLLAITVSYLTGFTPAAIVHYFSDHTTQTAQTPTLADRPVNKQAAAALNPNAPESKEAATLDALILAEVAHSNGDDRLALTYYQQALTLSHSPEIAQKATELALEEDQSEAATFFAQEWANLAPHDLSAQLIATTLLLSDESDRAEQYLAQALEIAPQELASHLAIIHTRLPLSGRLLLQKTVIDLAAKNPDNAYAQFLAAQTTLYEQDFDLAKQYLAAAFRLMPDLTNAIELQAKLYRHDDGNDKRALAYLDEQLKKSPNNTQLRAFYANALLDAKNYAVAIQQLQPLLSLPRYRPATLLLLGEVYYLMGNQSSAITTTKQVLEFPEQRAAANYLLGEIYKKQNNNTLALEHFSNVTEGEYHVPAVLNSAMILNKTQQFDDALELLRSAEPSDFHEQKQLLLLEIRTLINANNAKDALALVNEILESVPDDPDFLLQQKALQQNHAIPEEKPTNNTDKLPMPLGDNPDLGL